MKSVLKNSAVLILISLFSQQSFAQNGVHITYRIDPVIMDITLPFTIEGKPHVITHKTPVVRHHLFYTDSAAFAYSVVKGRTKNLYKKTDSVFGLRNRHHNNYYDIINNKMYHLVAFPKKKDRYFLPGTPIVRHFVEQEHGIMISGINCTRGYTLLGAGDTLYALISKMHRPLLGPSGFEGLPGLVIKSWRPRKGTFIYMEAIETGNFRVIIPNYQLRTKEEYYRKRTH